MHLFVWLVPGTLFSTCVHAFYPYHEIGAVTGTDEDDGLGLGKRTLCRLGLEDKSAEGDRVDCQQVKAKVIRSIRLVHALRSRADDLSFARTRPYLLHFLAQNRIH